MLQIRIESTELDERRGEKDGKAYHIRNQFGRVRMYDRNGKLQNLERDIKIRLERDQQPHEPGEYILAPQSFYLDQYQGLRIGKMVLMPRGTHNIKAA